ncbi:MAG: DUF6790 family protein [Gemmatimonadota bacterium]
MKGMGVSLQELEWDRRLVMRIFLRLLVAGASLLSAWALARGGGPPVLLDVEPRVPTALTWMLAALHLAAGVGLLIRRFRRGSAALLAALLLGWMAYLGARAEYVPAMLTGILLVLTLGAASPEDEGPWRPRERGVGGEALLALRICGTGFFGRFILGGPVFLLLPLVGGWMHHRVVTRLGSRRTLWEVLLLWVILFWIGVGGVWSFLGHTLRADEVAAFIGWRAGSPFQLELAAYHLAFAVLALLAFWIRDGLWIATVVGKAIFLYGAAMVHLWDWRLTGNTHDGNTGVMTLWVGDVLVPTVMLILLGLALAARRGGGVRPAPSERDRGPVPSGQGRGAGTSDPGGGGDAPRPSSAPRRPQRM